MARYMIVSKGAPLDKIETELRRFGAKNIKRHDNVGQLSCDLEPSAVDRLSENPGISVKPVREIKSFRSPAIVTAPVRASITKAPQWRALRPLQTEPDVITSTFGELRAFYSPPLTGFGLTVAVLDTGIRKTHVSLKGRVVYEYNVTDSPTAGDVWGHGTGVAYIICGEDSNRVGVAPGAYVMNIKVINDEGIATTETLVAGIDKVISLVRAARFEGKSPLDPMFPNIINISIGGEDTGDDDDPILVAARRAIQDWETDIIAAAGNIGPERSTIMVPAAEPLVIAVGGTEVGTVNVWEKSSRGPTLLGATKPDLMAWATNITVATHKDDTGYEVKSGTSFSSPIICGLTGLLWETSRANVSPIIAPLFVFRWGQLFPYAPYFCLKPSDAATIKDNTYGYGTPAGGVMMQQMTTPSGGAGDITQMMPAIMMMAMLSGIMPGMAG